jgi:DNA-binding transcriptional ArsR family regulator
MKLRREYRRRDETEVAILEALVDRYGEGMTVFELRSHVGADIDELEMALADLKEDDLISASEDGNRTLITIEDSVVQANGEEEEAPADIFQRILDRLGL